MMLLITRQQEIQRLVQYVNLKLEKIIMVLLVKPIMYNNRVRQNW